MVVGNHQCNAANLNQSKPQFQLELSLAQFSTSLFHITFDVVAKLGYVGPKFLDLKTLRNISWTDEKKTTIKFSHIGLVNLVFVEEGQM